MKINNKKLDSIIKEAIDNVLSSDNNNNNNNNEDLLINASVNEIELNAEADDMGLGYKLNIVIDNKPININGLLFKAEDKSRISEGAYQLHIVLPTNLRQKGIATKLYTVFLTKYGDIISLYSNRVGTYASKVNKSENFDSAIDKMLITVAKNTNANIEKLFSDNKEIGIIVSLNN